MSEHNASSNFIRDANGEFVGVVTDNDLRKKVTAAGYDIQKPVRDIMFSPLVTLSSSALIFETMMLMMQKNIKHLAVRDSTDTVAGVVTNRNLLKTQRQSPFFIMREIAQARLINQLIEVRRHIPRLLQSLINTGAKARNIIRFLATVSDAVLQKIIAFALAEMGPPPAGFAFMLLGSEGRRKQTLKTDQNNAIVFEDLPAKTTDAATKYFLSFAEKFCGRLAEAGYSFCKSSVMAKNPQWCQPLQTWKLYFTEWIQAAAPEALLQSSIFFDFRPGFGDAGLVNQLRSHLFDSLAGCPGFFRHLTENALFFKPPIGFFRNFLVESKGEHRDSFDIKAAMQPVAEPDNYVNPKKLSRIEQTTLKEIFKRIEKFQAKLSLDFKAMT